MAFAKYEGLGNDFVVVEEQLPIETRVLMCDRHRGIGADGVLTVTPTSNGRAPRSASSPSMHITNPDGSVPEMCGNGLRCVALYLRDRGLLRVGEARVVETGAGPRTCTVLDDDRVTIDMGPASFEVPSQFTARFREPLDGFLASTVSMGNPHLVIEREPDVDVAKQIGPVLERAKEFPERTNVELAALRKDGSIDVVVWERGAGLTQACGTGACGVAAVFARAGLVPYDVDVVVRLPGGPLTIRVPKDSTRSVWMTGPARRVFVGVFGP